MYTCTRCLIKITGYRLEISLIVLIKTLPLSPPSCVQVTIVRWNPLLDKIATCDSSGTVIVWRNHNGRSVMELVNNRGSQISDFQWSNDGSKVLITYVDGYVLVGTAFGRRIWARQLNIGSFVTTPSNHMQPSHLLSSTWSPDDTRIVVGSSIGELIELDAFSNGSLVSTTEVLPGIGIIGLQWVRIPGGETEKTKILSSSRILEDNEEKQNVRLSLYLRNGKVVLMNSCGDQQATIIRTGLMDGKMLWSQDGSILAVSGLRKSQGVSTVRFFQPSGQLLFTLPLNTKVSLEMLVLWVSLCSSPLTLPLLPTQYTLWGGSFGSGDMFVGASFGCVTGYLCY